MAVDVVLILITLAVAVVGTLLKDPPTYVKTALIFLAVLASVASVIKAREDSNDKNFLKTAIMSNLTPSSAVYGRLVDAVSTVGKRLGYADGSCFHNEAGLACFLSSKGQNSKHGTLVLNRLEIAQLYANDIQRTSNDSVINTFYSRVYEPSRLEEEFEDKVAVLGAAVFFNVYGRWPQYSYDDHNGRDLTLGYEQNGKAWQVQFSGEEIKAMAAAKTPDVFYSFEQRFRQEYAKSPFAADNGLSSTTKTP